jgi:hypothetical protein
MHTTKIASKAARRSSLVFMGLIAIAVVANISSVDSAGVNDDPLQLPRFGLIDLPGALAFAALLWGLWSLKVSRFMATVPSLSRICMISAIAVPIGILLGTLNRLPHLGFVGPEARGLFFACAVMVVSGVSIFYKPERFQTLVWVLVLSAAGRAIIEWLFLDFHDDYQGILGALIAVTTQFYALKSAGKRLWLLIPAAFLDVAILLSTRRTPVLILGLGIVLSSATVVLSRKSAALSRVVATFLSVALIIAIFAIDQNLLNGQLTDRLTSIDPKMASLPGTSNYEHLKEMEECSNLAFASPILGYGTGTVIPGRTIDRAGDMIPIHSPHFHSWLRFGLFGLLSYVGLQLFALILLIRATLGSGRMAHFEAEYQALLIGLNSYLFAQWALPPFYIDFKQGFGLGVLLGMAAALQARFPNVVMQTKIQRLLFHRQKVRHLEASPYVASLAGME